MIVFFFACHPLPSYNNSEKLLQDMTPVVISLPPALGGEDLSEVAMGFSARTVAPL